VLYTLRDVEEGESLTVMYTNDGSYFPEGCMCATCHPEQPPVLIKRSEPDVKEEEEEGEEEEEEAGPSKKKTRRGGRRAKSKRKKADIMSMNNKGDNVIS
jgi:3'-phosphoadenosine 5'-phosphosulfate sulfotransferase (PAPS reductase)/FAD synthetase